MFFQLQSTTSSHHSLFFRWCGGCSGFRLVPPVGNEGVPLWGRHAYGGPSFTISVNQDNHRDMADLDAGKERNEVYHTV